MREPGGGTMIQAFDSRSPVLLDPAEIQVGDWMRDIGRLRQVEAVEKADSHTLNGYLVRFSDAADDTYATLSIPAGITVTVWRPAQEMIGAARV
jgi:hypothetical protein